MNKYDVKKATTENAKFYLYNNVLGKTRVELKGPTADSTTRHHMADHTYWQLCSIIRPMRISILDNLYESVKLI